MSLSYNLHRSKEDFAFSTEAEEKIKTILKKYPKGREQSAVLPVLDLAQRDNGGWLSKQAIVAVAQRLSMPDLKVWEIASFYSMFYLDPVGKHLVQVCRTTPCWLRGSDEVLQACKDKLGVEVGGTSEDGKFTVVEVECLGACVNAPMVQINDDYYEDLTYDSMTELLENLADQSEVNTGTQINRLNSAPAGGLTTLKDVPPTKPSQSAKRSAKMDQDPKADPSQPEARDYGATGQRASLTSDSKSKQPSRKKAEKES